MNFKLELLQSADASGFEAFRACLKQVVNKDVEFPEIAELLSKHEHDRVCGKLLSFCENSISFLNLDENYDDDEVDFGEAEVEEIKNMRLIASITTLYLDLAHRPAALFDLVQKLHDLLIPLNDSDVNTQALKVSISRICETCWVKDERGAENFVTQLIPYLMLNSLSPTARENDIKRVYNIRTSILLLGASDI